MRKVGLCIPQLSEAGTISDKCVVCGEQQWMRWRPGSHWFFRECRECGRIHSLASYSYYVVSGPILVQHLEEIGLSKRVIPKEFLDALNKGVREHTPLR